MDEHAQFEIRSYAHVIGNEIVSRWCPLAWQAFLDYRMNASSLSRLEVEIVKAIQSGNAAHAKELAIEFGLLPPDGTPVKRNREREDLEAKLQSLNIPIPWK